MKLLLLWLSIVHPSLALLGGLGLTTMPSPRMRFGRRQDSFTTSNTPTPPRVQRDYETWTWKSNHGSFRINYRVEGPKEGPPILLTHGFGGKRAENSSIVVPRQYQRVKTVNLTSIFAFR